MNVKVTTLGSYNKVSVQRLDEEQHQQAEVRNSRHASGQRQTQCHTDENVDS